jgi:HlyD family secretion protein
MRKLTVLLVTILIVAAALVYFYLNRADQQSRFRLAQVERGPIISAVSSSGTLNAVITVQVGSQVSGQIKELLADFNSEVRAGQVIARIDPQDFEARVRQAEAELEVARANVAIQRAAVERARAELRNAQAALAAAKAETDKTSVAVTDAKRDLDRKQALHKRAVISKSDLEKAMVAHEQAMAQLNLAQAEQQAQASLVNSRKAMLRMAEEQVVHAIAQVEHREAFLHQSKIDLEHTIIRSPVDGVVIERSVDIGQTVAASLQAPTLFTIAQDLRKMQVDTDIDEADIGRILDGQRATFTVDAFPGKEFGGRVEQIRKAPHTLQNVVTYTVVVSTENPDLRLLPGMTANVKIVVDERTEALTVPNAALRFRPADKEKEGIAAVGDATTGGAPGSEVEVPPDRTTNRLSNSVTRGRVWALDPEGKPSPVDVIAGISDGSFTEIVRGDLKPGQKVIVGVIYPSQGSSSPTKRLGF